MKKTTFHGGIFLLILLTYGLPLYSQDIEWEKSIGGKHADYLFDAIPTADYGFILAGSSLSGKTGKKLQANQGDLDYWIWKMDEKGEMEWQKSFGGSGLDLLKCIKHTNDGGFILAGNSKSGKSGDKSSELLGGDDIWILKLDAKGNVLWQLALGGEGQDLLGDLIVTQDGGFLIGINSSSSSTLYNQSQTDLKRTDKSKLLLKSTNSFGNLDFWIVKIDRNGDLEWERSYGGQYSDKIQSILESKDGSFLIGGTSNSTEYTTSTETNLGYAKTEKNYGMLDYCVLKLDKKGELLWEKVFGGDKDDFLMTVVETSKGNYILGGNSWSQVTGNKDCTNKSGSDFWIIEINVHGEIIWQKSYDIDKNDKLTSMFLGSDESILIGGMAVSETQGTPKRDKEGVGDFVLIKTSLSGDEVWRKYIGSNDQNALSKVFEARDGGYILSGTANGKSSRDRKSSVGREDFWVVKLKDKSKKEVVKETIEAFPNPVETFTNVIVNYEFKSGEIFLYDLSGRLHQNFAIENRTIPLNMTGLPRGIYVVKVKTDVQENGLKIMKL
ncbi:T9SS type A sorting domain-containing protein [Flavobacterium sp.]|uniref:T9SS type A sorting domain-containing protein n=1 Tax=Flavobacterium sp. TaxID=239 RepID=UPI002FD93E66